MRAGDEIVLLGAGEDGVTPIRTYSEAEARALGLLERRASPTPTRPRDGSAAPLASGFIDILRAKTVIK